MWQDIREELFDYNYLIKNNSKMSNTEFMISMELSIRKRYGKIGNVINDLPDSILTRLFTTQYNDVFFKNQYAFLHSTYIPILLRLSKINRIPKDIVSPYSVFIVNHVQFVSAISGELDAIIYSKYYSDIYSNIDFDIDSWSRDNTNYEMNVLESVINFYIDEMHTYLDNLRDIFINTNKGMNYNRGSMEYRNLIRMIIPHIAESVVIAFSEIISDTDFAELNAISNYNRYGMNRNELFDKVIDRMLISFGIKG